MLLPNELLLEALHFADFGTLVAAKLAAARLLDVVTKFAAELACRHSFDVEIFVTYINYVDRTIYAFRRSIQYESANQSSLSAACRELAEIIGPHVVAMLTFYENAWNMSGVGVVFEAAPALKYARSVGLYSAFGSTIANDCAPFMQYFAGTKSLHLSLTYDVFRNFSWTFLCREAACELRRISMFTEQSDLDEDNDRPVEELVRYCAKLPHLLGGEPLELEFRDNYLSGAFGMRTIELLKGTGHGVIFRMKTRNVDELILDTNDYTLDVDDTTTRYA
ncbi:hypothetical protein AAVH_27680 [Aphelenchoides avenae]|nr:hypothetical protein AAVH_27680 [Aphelenchus avenae]